MSAAFKFTGLDELRAELRNLPTELAGEASHIVVGEGNSAVAEIRREYPFKTGNLVEHVTATTLQAGPVASGVSVKSSARHAWLVEYGSQARYYVTRGGNRHHTGKMPPKPVFVPAMVRARQRMYEQLQGLLERHGLTVTRI